MSTKYDENDVFELYNEMDKNSDGEIQYNKFIKTLIEKTRENKNEKFSEFYFSAVNFYLTPSTQIIKTIKNAIAKLQIYNEDEKIVKELQWVINTLSEKDLFDFRLKDEIVDTVGLEETDIIKFLSEYSNDVEKRQKNQDLESINTIIMMKKQRRDCILILFKI
jgi:hypothetical protein